MTNTKLDVPKKQGQTGIKKYQRYASQVEIELDQEYDWISILTTFIRHLYQENNIREVIENMKIRRNIKLE